MRRLLLAGCVALFCCAGRAGVAMPPKWSEVLTRSGAIEAKHGHIQGICAARDALLWIPDFGAGLVYTLDPDTPYQTPKPVMSGFNLPGRGAFISRRRATMLIFR